MQTTPTTFVPSLPVPSSPAQPSAARSTSSRRPSRPRMTVASPPPPAAPLPNPDPSPSSSPPAAPAYDDPANPVRQIDGIDEYLATLRGNAHRLVVLKVFAPWCRSCRALVPKVNRLARDFDDVLFVKIDYERNKNLCRRLGVHTMPTFIFYAGTAGEVEKFSCGPMRAHILRQKVEDCVRGRCLLDDNPQS